MKQNVENNENMFPLNSNNSCGYISPEAYGQSIHPDNVVIEEDKEDGKYYEYDVL